MFPPEGVPSLEMLLDSGSCEPDEADDSEGGDGDNDDDECRALGAGQVLGKMSETDDMEHHEDNEETGECTGSSSDEDSDADNGMGRKAGVVRVMVESFADRCVKICAIFTLF